MPKPLEISTALRSSAVGGNSTTPPEIPFWKEKNKCGASLNFLRPAEAQGPEEIQQRLWWRRGHLKFHRRLEVQGPPKNSNAAPRKSKGEKCGEPLKYYRRSAARRAEEFWPVTAENKKGHFRLTFSFFRSFYLHLRFKRIHKYNSFCLQAEPNATFDWSRVTFVFFVIFFELLPSWLAPPPSQDERHRSCQLDQFISAGLILALLLWIYVSVTMKWMNQITLG